MTELESLALRKKKNTFIVLITVTRSQNIKCSSLRVPFSPGQQKTAVHTDTEM